VFIIDQEEVNLYIHTYITFISGVKSIAENRQNMKKTKIKYTNTHTNQSTEKTKIKTKIGGYFIKTQHTN